MKYLLIVFLLFYGCVKKPVKSLPVYVSVKCPNLRFSDSGFLRYNGHVALQVYSAGSALMELKISNRVCVNGRCMSKESFNEKFLSPYYPKTLLEDILRRRPIFGGENLKRTEDGFIQRIKSPHLDIIYKVNSKEVYFKDRKNAILIKIKELDV